MTAPAPTTKAYRGTTDRMGRRIVNRIGEDGKARRLTMRLDLRNHSPTGMNWGYAGSGPAQLALAILADALDDDTRALALYQRFKFAAIVNISGDSFVITRDMVLAIVNDIETRIDRREFDNVEVIGR